MRKRNQRGAVTAETAVVLPLIAAFGLLMLWCVCVGVAQVRVVDAAREGARVAARGDGVDEASSWAQRVAPERADVHIDTSAREVTAQVSAPVDGPGGIFRMLPALTVRATAVAAAEETGE